ncbi:MAG: response regulator transcription factor [Gemmatimonadota bacterium]
MKILLVEDTVGDAIRRVLLKWGHEVSLATSGAEARELLGPPYDLFLVDWMLPDISGLEIVGTIRRDVRHAGAAVLMISSRAEREDILTAIRSGIDGYVAKPFKAGELRARIDEVWQRRSRELDSGERARLILDRQEGLQTPGTGPLIVFGEGVVTEDELTRPGSRDVLDYLTAATTAIAAANAYQPGLRLGYVLVGSTGDVTQRLHHKDTRHRVQLALVSPSCYGNCTVMARLIGMRGGDVGCICIVCDRSGDLTRGEIRELERYGVAVVARWEFDADRWRDIIEGRVIERWALENPGKLPAEQLADGEREVLAELDRLRSRRSNL